VPVTSLYEYFLFCGSTARAGSEIGNINCGGLEPIWRHTRKLQDKLPIHLSNLSVNLIFRGVNPHMCFLIRKLGSSMQGCFNHSWLLRTCGQYQLQVAFTCMWPSILRERFDRNSCIICNSELWARQYHIIVKTHVSSLLVNLVWNPTNSENPY